MAYMVVNSRYNPFTYDELVKPLADYTTAYEKQEALADAYATAAANLDALSPDLDSAEYQNYTGWKNELKAASDMLATSGLTPEVRSALKSLGTRFSTELNPALEKMKTRAELVKEQRAAQAKNPNIMFDIDYSATPLSSISPSSTYNTYDLDSILTGVGNDVYNRMLSGQTVPSADEYITKYGAGLTSANQLSRIRDAVSSGMSLGNSTYQQKELENYLKRVQAFKTGSSGGSGGVGSTSNFAVRNHEGNDIIATYDKKLGAYKIKDKNNKDVVIRTNEPDDVLRGYYGGDYDYINVFGSTVPRIKTTQTLGSGQSREVYSVLLGGKWKELPKGGNTTKRELYKELTNENLAALTETERKRRMGSVSDKDIENNVSKGKWTAEDVDYHDYAVNLTDALVKKLDALESVGATFNTTIYKDKNGQIVGWDISSDNDDIDTPIEYVDNYR